MKVKPAGKLKSVDDPVIRVMSRKNNALVVTWRIHSDWKKRLEKTLSIPWKELPVVLRLYDVTEREICGDGRDAYVDYEINLESGEWLLFGMEKGKKYCVELGVRMLGGRFHPIGRSNQVQI